MDMLIVIIVNYYEFNFSEIHIKNIKLKTEYKPYISVIEVLEYLGISSVYNNLLLIIFKSHKVVFK